MEQLSPDSRIVLSTDAIEDRDRDGLVRDFYGRICMRLDLAPAEDRTLRLEAATTVLPNASVTRGRVAPMSWERTSALMADANDDLVISWMSGGYRFDRQGRESIETRPGAACLMPLDQAWRAQTGDGDWTVCLQLRRAQLTPLIDDLGDLAPDAINPQSAEGRLLLDYAAAVSGAELGPALAPLVSQHLSDLVALCLGASGEARQTVGQRGGRAAQMRALKQHVAENLANPHLSAETAARALGFSARQVRRLFESESRSFSDYVVERRLERVLRDIKDPRLALRPIAEIAFNAGWVEPSTFYRQFKARYGFRPSDARP